MRPILFEVGGIKFYAYGVFFLLALAAGLAMLAYEARRRRWKREEAVPIVIAAFVGGMVGARVSIYFFNGPQSAPETLNFFALFDPRIGPGSVLGGVAGAYAGGYIANRAIGRQGCACDAFAPALALGLAIGRIGDYLAGVNGLGKPTTLPWGVALPGTSTMVHPAPLYDAAFDLVWFAVLMTLRDHLWMQKGNLLKFGLVGYAVARFCIEFVRNNQLLLWGLTGQQLVCLGLLMCLGIWYLWWRPKALMAS